MAKHKKVRHPRQMPAAAAPAPAPMPGPHEFSADDEQAMRAGRRQAREPMPPPDTDMDGM